MSYDTYRPDWDPFFSEVFLPKPPNQRIDWGDRSSDPKSDRKIRIGGVAEPKVLPEEKHG